MSTIDRVGKHRKTRSFRVGLGSLIDIQGMATYEAMRALMPEPPKRSLRDSIDWVNHMMAPPRPR